LPDYLKLVFDLAKKNNKRIGSRIQMCAPDYTHSAALPDFVLDKVPKVDLVLSDQESRASANTYSSGLSFRTALAVRNLLFVMVSWNSRFFRPKSLRNDSRIELGLAEC
jgi:hypothetical protein